MVIDIITILSISIFVTYTTHEILKIVHQDIQTLAAKIVKRIM